MRDGVGLLDGVADGVDVRVARLVRFVDGNPAVLGSGGNAVVATSGTWPAGFTLNPTTGAISTTASAISGTFASVAP